MAGETSGGHYDPEEELHLLFSSGNEHTAQHCHHLHPLAFREEINA